MRLRDYILLGAALAGDAMDEYRLGWGVVPSAMKNMYGFVPERYKRASLLSGVSRMLSVGEIKRITDKRGKTHLELTSSGETKFKRRFSIFNQNKKWDGVFMLVIFDIPEGRKMLREKLREKLNQLGFGMLQKSIYISPYHFEGDLREFLQENRLEDEAFVLSAKKLLAGDFKKLSREIWPLSELNEAYRQVISLVGKSQESMGKEKLVILNSAYSLYLDTLSQDPLLPYDLLPSDWFQPKALEVLGKAVREVRRL